MQKNISVNVIDSKRDFKIIVQKFSRKINAAVVGAEKKENTVVYDLKIRFILLSNKHTENEMLSYCYNKLTYTVLHVQDGSHNMFYFLLNYLMHFSGKLARVIFGGYILVESHNDGLHSMNGFDSV